MFNHLNTSGHQYLTSFTASRFMSKKYCARNYVNAYGSSDFCYMLVKSGKKYDAAQAYCKRYKGMLVEFKSTQEASGIAQYFRKKSSTSYRLWIGLRHVKSSGSDWKWDSGKKVSYQPWIESRMKQKSFKYDCAHLIMGGKTQVKSTVGKWGGSNCDSRLYTVCMRKCK